MKTTISPHNNSAKDRIWKTIPISFSHIPLYCLALHNSMLARCKPHRKDGYDPAWHRK